jgi:large subunit ribosomal protein L17
MRHRVAHRKLGRTTEHRIALLRNQATALLRHEHLTTTVPKAKELRPFVERLITIAKRGVADAAPVRTLNARRLVMRDVQDQDVVRKLFDTLAPRFASRAGGYTRLLRIGFRRGDAAEMAQVELVGSEFETRLKASADAEPAAEPATGKGVGGRLRAAAGRLRGKKDDEPAAEAKTTARSGKSKASPRKKAKSDDE